MDKNRFLDTHSWTQEETFKKLETSLDGLTDKEALERQTIFGKNLIKEEKVSKWKLFFRQFQNPLVYILFFASLMSLFIQEFTDFFVIIGILLINGFIGFWQEWKAEVTLIDLKKLTAKDIVIDKKRIEISLPHVEVLNFSYPFSTYQIDSSVTRNAFLNKLDVMDHEKFYMLAELDIRNNLQYTGVKESTENNTRLLLEGILKNLGYREIFITFKEGELITPIELEGSIEN